MLDAKYELMNFLALLQRRQRRHVKNQSTILSSRYVLVNLCITLLNNNSVFLDTYSVMLDE